MPLLDPSFTNAQKEQLHSDFTEISKLEVNPQKLVNEDFRKAFLKMFSGGGVSGTGAMLSQRIHYLLPPQSGWSEEFIDPRVIAVNHGTQFWYQKKLNYPVPTLDGKPLPTHNRPLGIIELRPSFWENPAGPDSWIRRISKLVHEARHSDCSQIPDESDLAALERGELMKKSHCGYPHVMCPAGHELEGLPGCDSPTWGSFAIEAMWLKGTLQSCTNCTAQQKAIFEAMYLDVTHRVQNYFKLEKNVKPQQLNEVYLVNEKLEQKAILQKWYEERTVQYEKNGDVDSASYISGDSLQ